MQLVKTVKTYNTLELLRGMVEISTDHFKNPMYNNAYPLEKATMFSFGRRCGHTNAIKQYVQGSDDEIVVVCDNITLARDINKELGFDVAISINVIKNLNRFRGCTTIPSKIIFDSCSMNDIHYFIEAVMVNRIYDIQAITIIQTI
jgi:hypothetical protein